MRWLGVVVLIAALAAPAAAQVSGAPTQVLQNLDRAIVLITVTVDSGNRTLRGSGSGILIESSGVILTANHVVARARTIEVTLWTGETLPARVLGVDPLIDAALIKVETRLPLPTAMFGSSSVLQMGQMLNALGRAPRRQAGPTSGQFLEEDIESRPGVPYLRTQATVWPGDSGGALVNEHGEVVGLIVAITRDGSVSLGVAIDTIKNFLPDLRVGVVRHAWLGITGATITNQLVRELGLAVRSGVIVYEVVPGGPAAQAGLRGGVVTDPNDVPRGGDIIVAIDGQPVQTFGALAAHVLSKRIGDTVTLEFIRGGQVFSTSVVLGERPGI